MSQYNIIGIDCVLVYLKSEITYVQDLVSEVAEMAESRVKSSVNNGDLQGFEVTD